VPGNVEMTLQVAMRDLFAKLITEARKMTDMGRLTEQVVDRSFHRSLQKKRRPSCCQSEKRSLKLSTKYPEWEPARLAAAGQVATTWARIPGVSKGFDGNRLRPLPRPFDPAIYVTSPSQP